jgi:hypothetical protein
MPLARVLLRHSHCIEIEFVVVPLREPKNCLVPSTKAAAGVYAVPKGPNNPISQEEFLLFGEDIIDERVQRNDNTILYVVPNLPAYAPSVLQRATSSGANLSWSAMKSLMLSDVSYALPMQYGGDDTIRSTEPGLSFARNSKAS